jgi:hypothetical protein
MLPVTSLKVQYCHSAAMTTSKNWKFEVPPPGAGLTTVIVAVVGFAMSVARIAAVNCELLVKVVVRGLPFQSTTDPATKPVPVTVRLNAAPPGAAAEGTTGFRYGTGLGVVASANPLKTPSSITASASTTKILRKSDIFIEAPLRDISECAENTGPAQGKWTSMIAHE